MPLPRSLNNLAALRSGRHFEIRLAFERRHGDFAAERGQRERDRHFAIKIVFFALENFVLLDVNHDVKVALRAAANAGFAVARRTQPRAVADSSRGFSI